MAKNNNINWWLLIGVAIVVAVIASLITASITGNVIKVNQDKWGKNLVYTKAEIDGMMKNIKAASCDADDICEMKTISTEKGSNSGLILTSDTNEVYIGGELRIRNIYGVGNAYACISPEGKLFRSRGPCIENDVTVTLNGTEIKTFTIRGKDYSAQLITTGSSTSGIIKIDDVAKSVREGNTYSFKGDINIYIKDIIHPAYIGDSRGAILIAS